MDDSRILHSGLGGWKILQFTLDNKKTNIHLLRPGGPHKHREMDCVKYLAQIVTITWHTDVELTVFGTHISILSADPPISSEKQVEQVAEQRRKLRD